MADQIFVIVNPKSGGNRGAVFLEVPQPFTVTLDNGNLVSLRIYSILDGESGKKPAFQAVREATLRSATPVKVIIGGGDGTVMFADSECEKHGIDSVNKVLYGIIPLGTGNDFSRSYGWGGKNPTGILDYDCAALVKLAKRWAAATPVFHDVWQVVLKVNPETGAVLKVNSDREEEVQPEKAVVAPMVNYFSIGQESRMGIDFDKHRTKSQTANLAVYCLAGLKTEFCCGQKWSHIGSVVGSLHAGVNGEAPIIFNQDHADDEPDLINNPECLMFLNINSYAGGLAHFWHTDSKIGVDPEPDSDEIDVELDPGDGRLEVVTVPNLLTIGIEQAVSLACRIHSGGPYYIKFEDDDDTPENLEAWVEVDGEFYHLVDPSEATLTLKKKLRVLRDDAS